jgi:hypothetical protein
MEQPEWLTSSWRSERRKSHAAFGCPGRDLVSLLFLRLYPESAADALSDEVFRLIGVENDQDKIVHT